MSARREILPCGRHNADYPIRPGGGRNNLPQRPSAATRAGASPPSASDRAVAQRPSSNLRRTIKEHHGSGRALIPRLKSLRGRDKKTFRKYLRNLLELNPRKITHEQGLVMNNKVICILFGMTVAFMSSAASAGWLYASSFQYFNASGVVVGQSILSCSTTSPRKFSGVVSSYWRQDSVLCSNLVGITGWQCFYGVNNDNPALYPAGTWDCTTQYTQVEKPGEKVINDVNKLPPGMSLESSCQKVGCDVRASQFIPALANGAVVDSNNSSVPAGATDPIQ